MENCWVSTWKTQQRNLVLKLRMVSIRALKKKRPNKNIANVSLQRANFIGHALNRTNPKKKKELTNVRVRMKSLSAYKSGGLTHSFQIRLNVIFCSVVEESIRAFQLVHSFGFHSCQVISVESITSS